MTNDVTKEPLPVALVRIDYVDETGAVLEPGAPRVNFSGGSAVNLPVDQLDRLIGALTCIRERYRRTQMSAPPDVAFVHLAMSAEL